MVYRSAERGSHLVGRNFEKKIPSKAIRSHVYRSLHNPVVNDKLDRIFAYFIVRQLFRERGKENRCTLLIRLRVVFCGNFCTPQDPVGKPLPRFERELLEMTLY